MGISKKNPDKKASKKGLPKGLFKRILKHGSIYGAIFGVIVFMLDFFNVNVDVLSKENRPPEIQDKIQLSRNCVPVGETATAIVLVNDDNDEDEIHYFWGSSLGRIQLDRFQGPKCTYIAPDQPGVDFITVTVYDGEGATDKDFIHVTIVETK